MYNLSYIGHGKYLYMYTPANYKVESSREKSSRLSNHHETRCLKREDNIWMTISGSYGYDLIKKISCNPSDTILLQRSPLKKNYRVR
jgi:hypothetical protein